MERTEMEWNGRNETDGMERTEMERTEMERNGWNRKWNRNGMEPEWNGNGNGMKQNRKGIGKTQKGNQKVSNSPFATISVIFLVLDSHSSTIPSASFLMESNLTPSLTLI